jgi:protein TonB
LGYALPLDGGQERGNGEGLSLSLMALSVRGTETAAVGAPRNENLAQTLRAEAASVVPQEARASAAENVRAEGGESAKKAAPLSANNIAPQKKNVTRKTASEKKADAPSAKKNTLRAAGKNITPRKEQASSAPAEVGNSGTVGKSDAAASLANARELQGEGGVAEVPFGRACGPAFRHFSRPVYPLQARRAGISGLVKLRVSLDDAGTVRSVEVLESGHRLLADAACESIRLSSFRPYTENGKSLPSRTIIPIRFSLEQAL